VLFNAATGFTLKSDSKAASMIDPLSLGWLHHWLFMGLT